MEKSDLRRLIKIEDRIKQLCDEWGLKCMPVEFDIVPPEKMMEIMAYHNPTNISNWKFGRDYERLKTIFDTIDPNLPYEMVINDDPARAYLMRSNTLAVQALVIAHVYAHVNFFTENKWFQKSRRDIIEMMAEAAKRFNDYERLYGIDEVEQVVDAGHALQWHSSPFESETEMDKKKRVFEQLKKQYAPTYSEFGDLVESEHKKKMIVTDTELYNNKLWRKILSTTPIEPTEDILRFVIDNSRILEDWQTDILETLRTEGQYYWPNYKTKYMNEGWATFWHEKMMNKLFEEGLLTSTEHGQYNISNSLVKAQSRMSMNPYMIGSAMWTEIEERWDKGRFGMEYDNCTDLRCKEEWDTKLMKGREKIFDMMKSYTDWFFMQDFLTPEVIDKLDLYIYRIVETVASVDYIRSEHTAEQIRDLIVASFANSGIPKIEIVNGNLMGDGTMELEHRFNGLPLDKKYTEETLRHIHRIWGCPVILKTAQVDNKGVAKEIVFKEDGSGGKKTKAPQDDDEQDQLYRPFSFRYEDFNNFTIRI
jgi:stage V sporulation protein R